MVSLENKNNYISQLIGQTGTRAFAEWISGLPLKAPMLSSFTRADDISYAAMYSVQGNCRDLFEKVYASLCRRRPEKDSNYIFNDILIFSTICGVLKYKIDRTWLKEACKLRLTSPDTEVHDITQAYGEILEGNLDGPTHCPEIAVACSFLIGAKGLGDAVLNRAYDRITKPSFPPYNSLFLNAIAIKAFDIIVKSKTISNQTEYEHLFGLNKAFESKSILVAKMVWWVIFVSVGAISVLYVIGGLNDLIKERLISLNILRSVFGIGGGVALWPLLSKRQKIIEPTAKLIKRFWDKILVAVAIVIAIATFVLLFSG
jgi:hypothetical protein